MGYYLVLVILCLILYRGLRYEHQKGGRHKKIWVGVGYYIFDKIILLLGNRFCKNSSIGSKIQKLNPAVKQEACIRDYYAGKFTLIFMAVLAGTVLSVFFLHFPKEDKRLINQNTIKRGNYGDGVEEVNLEIYLEEAPVQETIKLEIKEREYTTNEISKMLENGAKELKTLILGKNLSVDYIDQPIQLVGKLPNTPIGVEWTAEPNNIIDEEGEFNQEMVSDDGVIVRLYARLFYKELEEFQEILINVLPMKKTKTEQIISKVQERVESLNTDTKDKELFVLPDELDGNKIIWKEKNSNISKSILFLLGVLSILLYAAKDFKINEDLMKRNHQLFLDYPEIVSKLTLLIGAGMTIKGAFYKMEEDFKRISMRGERYAYLELSITLREIESGMTERMAYERYGQRVGQGRYFKLIALLIQNLKKGNRGLVLQLEQEVHSAFEERKNIAKRLGEEASTKLLGPMVLMLLVVMIILLVPAFLSMNI
jgi:tight adherence protein C